MVAHNLNLNKRNWGKLLTSVLQNNCLNEYIFMRECILNTVVSQQPGNFPKLSKTVSFHTYPTVCRFFDISQD